MMRPTTKVVAVWCDVCRAVGRPTPSAVELSDLMSTEEADRAPVLQIMSINHIYCQTALTQTAVKQKQQVLEFL